MLVVEAELALADGHQARSTQSVMNTSSSAEAWSNAPTSAQRSGAWVDGRRISPTADRNESGSEGLLPNNPLDDIDAFAAGRAVSGQRQVCRQRCGALEQLAGCRDGASKRRLRHRVDRIVRRRELKSANARAEACGPPRTTCNRAASWNHSLVLPCTAIMNDALRNILRRHYAVTIRRKAHNV